MKLSYDCWLYYNTQVTGLTAYVWQGDYQFKCWNNQSVHYSGIELEGKIALGDGGIDLGLDISQENYTDCQESCLLRNHSWNEADLKILGVYVA